MDARLPDGTVQHLIWIKDWDFNWQGQYRYVEPVKLPKGTRIDMRYIYDNSAGNPRNPSNPPRRVRFGEQTTDEMALAFLQVTVPRTEDVPAFRRAYLLSRIEQILIEGGDFDGLTRRQAEMLLAGVVMFDKNHNGKLDPDERAALMQFIAGNVK